jgi:hypothetical protein
MADLIKGVLGGGWSLVVGWILPVFLSIQFIAVLALPGLAARVGMVHQFLAETQATRQVTLLATAAVIGLVLAAAQAPLYQVLEGYVLWPPRLAQHRIRRHRARRAKLVAQQLAVAQTNQGVRSGLLYQRAARYPASDRQFAPTMLGNAIRRFETYAGDRYMMDSQLLWLNLTAVAPPPAVSAVDNARSNVDFFVSLLYSSVTTAAFGVITSTAAGISVRSGLAVGGGVLMAIFCYRLAVLATDGWDAAFRAVVDHGRSGVAAAFGMQIPASFAEERHMWRVVNTLVRRPYAYSESKDVASLIEQFRQASTHNAPTAPGRIVPPAVLHVKHRRPRTRRRPQ